MEKYVRRSRSSLAMVEVEVRTAESTKRRRKNARLPPERLVRTSSRQLHSRRIVMTARRARPRVASPPSSTAACPAAEVVVSDEKDNEGFQRSMSNLESRRGSEARREERDLESTSSSWLPAGAATNTMEAEIEKFFQAAEREQALRFADKYNYDVIGDVPLDGRFEWVGIDL